MVTHDLTGLSQVPTIVLLKEIKTSFSEVSGLNLLSLEFERISKHFFLS